LDLQGLSPPQTLFFSASTIFGTDLHFPASALSQRPKNFLDTSRWFLRLSPAVRLCQDF
jgi:hypothetical protein